MKKQKLLLFLIVFILLGNLFSILSACDTGDKPGNGQDDEITVVVLTMDNYQMYLNLIQTSTNLHPRAMKAEGCLDFAIYENVVITLSNGEIMKLNAAGEGIVGIQHDSRVVEITGCVKYRL